MENSGASLAFGLISTQLNAPMGPSQGWTGQGPGGRGSPGAARVPRWVWAPCVVLSLRFWGSECSEGACRTPSYVGQALGPETAAASVEECGPFAFLWGAGLGRACGKQDLLSSSHQPQDRGSFGPEEGRPLG